MYLTTLISVRVPEHDVVDSQIFGCVCQVHGGVDIEGTKFYAAVSHQSPSISCIWNRRWRLHLGGMLTHGNNEADQLCHTPRSPV